MSVRIKDVKYIDQRVKTIVNGYIRKCQQILPKNNPYFTISLLIIFKVILYYDELEHFDKSHCGPSMKISDDKNRTISMKGGFLQTVFGKKQVYPQSNTIIKYQFKMNNLGYATICFGFAANADNFSSQGSISDLYGTFGLRCDSSWGNGYVHSSTTQQFANSESEESSMTLEKGDTLTMILDLSSNQLWFQKGDNKKIKLFKDIPEYSYSRRKNIYKMFVEMCGECSVSLLNVECH